MEEVVSRSPASVVPGPIHLFYSANALPPGRRCDEAVRSTRQQAEYLHAVFELAGSALLNTLHPSGETSNMTA